MSEEFELINSEEGNVVKTVKWPFYRYKLLMPKEVDDNIFEWLYISIASQCSCSSPEKDKYGNDIDDLYDDRVKAAARKIMEQYFLNKPFDKTTLNKIIQNVESSYLIDHGNKISRKALDKLNSFDILFSNDVELKIIFQDAVTGNVLPLFFDSIELEEQNIVDQYGDGRGYIIKAGQIGYPKKRTIIRAFKKYKQLSKFNHDDVIDNLPQDDDEFAEEEPVILDNDDGENNEFQIQKKEIRKIDEYNIIIDNRLLLYLDVKIEILDNEPHLISPFEHSTNWWMNECYTKAKGNNQDILNLSAKLEERLIPKQEIKKFIEVNRKTIVDQLHYCGSIYRIIDLWGDDDLRELVVIIDKEFSRKRPDYYHRCGQLLEDMMKMVSNPNESNYYDRNPIKCITESDYEEALNDYRFRIKYKMSGTGLDTDRLTRKSVFDDWRKTISRNGSHNHKFKSDIADLFLTTEMSKSKFVTPDLINDMFWLYDCRNTDSHSYKESKKLRVKKEDIEKLEHIVEIISEFKLEGIKW